ncbi:hypothetical protein [Pedobacter sp. NJ-S-72]
MKIIPLIIISLLTLEACKSNQKTDNNISDTTKTIIKKKGNMDIEAIKKQIGLQKGLETNNVPNNEVHFLDGKDIELSLAVISEGLSNAGYSKPEKAQFERKIKEIFNCENSDNKLWKGIRLLTPVVPNSWMAPENFINYYGDNYGEAERNEYYLIAFNDHNFIFDINFLRDLIKISPNGEYKITLPKYLISRNNYLFNGSKTDLDFLLKNDANFVKSLVYVFGYDKDPAINSFVLNEYNTGTANDQKVGDVIFSDYDKPGKLKIRKGLLQYINEYTTQTENKIYTGLENYILGIDELTNVSFEDRCKMVAYAGTLGQRLHEKYYAKNPTKWAINSLLTNFKIQFPKYIDEIKKKDYYGDPEIKRAVATAEDEALQATTHADPQ